MTNWEAGNPDFPPTLREVLLPRLAYAIFHEPDPEKRAFMARVLPEGKYDALWHIVPDGPSLAAAVDFTPIGGERAIVTSISRVFEKYPDLIPPDRRAHYEGLCARLASELPAVPDDASALFEG
ncbi:hypothetical protein I6A60_31270 [Frankia sp. AgB1.9]|uniref:hypothetical protein n=1 Tax=unclassified Frankia TaxID=2632575 RepID=UPI0019333141|nr:MULTISPECIES: hypothetical protein [unclassified Frankia]MBL7493890.1 hypothetical protein [Frankia sp. AgW1.1]MBL7552311.1 hypothetical protein [Frankia sp. AgB1.9]MBL7622064.1 hypothetical protein [Frankia sp. AgB1.8]